MTAFSGEKIYIAAVCGPTASGKTELGVRLAERANGEIISADSMQIYKGMEIASAKPSEEEKRGIPHYLMDFLSPTEAFSVADYVELARKCIADIHGRGKLPIIVGGTGLYISSLVNNIRFDDTGSDPALREEMRSYAEKKGNTALWEKLREVDPAAAARLHPNNLNRVIRALEVFHLSGETISEAQEKSRLEESPYEACFIMPEQPREKLYGRINRRVDLMLKRGLVEEAVEFFSHSDYVTAAQAIGYKELKPFLDGERELSECVGDLKRSTRNYAKRQLTWFGKIEGLNKIKAEDEIGEEKISEIAENLVKRYRFF
ncbi:MAG: tRNA (adenosine(37)-N6)-dimethylallyltransferase MiaA [Bacteroides sp.]|nr:tRNA (adenosine(37)-N6)-dimethylallyltransferase MiaA [Bacteroides sp.]